MVVRHLLSQHLHALILAVSTSTFDAWLVIAWRLCCPLLGFALPCRVASRRDSAEERGVIAWWLCYPLLSCALPCRVSSRRDSKEERVYYRQDAKEERSHTCWVASRRLPKKLQIRSQIPPSSWKKVTTLINYLRQVGCSGFISSPRTVPPIVTFGFVRQRTLAFMFRWSTLFFWPEISDASGVHAVQVMSELTLSIYQPL